MKRLALCCILLLLSACGGETFTLGPQYWHNVQVVVETRPTPPVPGMNEFLVIATNRDHTKAYDMVVSLRTDPQGKWEQAIQDGFVGVYRRALPLHDIATDVLYVHLRKRDGSEGELSFPLSQPQAAAKP